MIEVKHIWFSYEQWGEFVLKDISFSVEKGEIVGVLGANGVGKTTLLKVLAGLLPPRPREKEPERGVWLNGKPIRECNAEIAFISEAGTYLKDLTPREYGAFLADFYPSFDMAYYEKLLHFFGFIPATLVFVAATMLAMGERRPMWFLLTTLGITGFIYVLFALVMNVVLPQGVLF